MSKVDRPNGAEQPSLFVTRDEAARLLGGLSLRTIDVWLAGGTLKRLPKGLNHRVLILRSSIDALVARAEKAE